MSLEYLPKLPKDTAGEYWENEVRMEQQAIVLLFLMVLILIFLSRNQKKKPLKKLRHR